MLAVYLLHHKPWLYMVHAGQEKLGNFDSLPNMHSTYGYCSLLKFFVKKYSANLIEQHPILYSEVFIYIHITIYDLHKYLYFIKYKCMKDSQKTERSLHSLSSDLHSGLRISCVFFQLHTNFYNENRVANVLFIFHGTFYARYMTYIQLQKRTSTCATNYLN